MKGQIRFLEDLDKIEKQKKDKLEQEKIIRAAKVITEGNILSFETNFSLESFENQ